jgi:hypothetical protein
MENRHSSTVAKTVKSIYDYMDMNKKASQIVNIIMHHKQKRSKSRKHLKNTIERLTARLAQYVASVCLVQLCMCV